MQESVATVAHEQKIGPPGRKVGPLDCSCIACMVADLIDWSLHPGGELFGGLLCVPFLTKEQTEVI